MVIIQSYMIDVILCFDLFLGNEGRHFRLESNTQNAHDNSVAPPLASPNYTDIITIDGQTLDIVGKIISIFIEIITIDGQALDIVGKIISNYIEIITIDGQTFDIVGQITSNYTNIITIDGQTLDIIGKIISNYTDIITN